MHPAFLRFVILIFIFQNFNQILHICENGFQLVLFQFTSKFLLYHLSQTLPDQAKIQFISPNNTNTICFLVCRRCRPRFWKDQGPGVPV